MLHLVTDRGTVIKCQEYLQNRINELLPTKATYEIGHLGRSFEMEVHTNGDIWHFAVFEGGRNPARYWNAFGIDSLVDRSNIVVEINIPVGAIYRRISGIFAEDRETNVAYLLHRGGIGGGRKGIGKRAFVAWYRRQKPSRWVELDEGEGLLAHAILVTALTRDAFLEDLTAFVRDAYEFKKLAVSGSVH